MSGRIPNGLYNILPAFVPHPSAGIGADTNVDAGAGLPVVFHGTNQVWKVEEYAIGVYYLTLEEGWKSTETNPHDGKYRILRYNWGAPRIGWTLASTEDKTPVVLESADEPTDFQQWIFRPVILD